MPRKKGSKNKKPAKAGQPRKRCVICGRKKYRSELKISHRVRTNKNPAGKLKFRCIVNCKNQNDDK